MKISIESTEVKTKHGTAKGSGKAYTSREQEAYLHQPGKKFPTSCTISLLDNAPAFPVGEYESAANLELNDFGNLQVSRDLGLVRLAVKA